MIKLRKQLRCVGVNAEHTIDSIDELLLVNRLVEEIKGAEFSRQRLGCGVFVAADHDHWNLLGLIGDPGRRRALRIPVPPGILMSRRMRSGVERSAIIHVCKASTAKVSPSSGPCMTSKRTLEISNSACHGTDHSQ